MISQQKKAKLIWQCRRGMLELDLILTRFLDKHLDGLTERQVCLFEKLLKNPDPDLFAWLMGIEEPMDQECTEIVAFIRHHDNI